MEGGKFDINAINRETAAKLNNEYKAKLKGKSVTPAKSSPSEVIHQNIYNPPKKEKKYTHSEMKTFTNVLTRKPNEDPEKQRQQLAKVKALKIRKITDYKSRTIFAAKLKHIHVPPASASMEAVDAVLDEIREILASEGAEHQIRMLPQFAAYGMEQVTMKWGFNPLMWDLDGFGEAFGDPRAQEALEPSLTEMVVEYKHYLCTPAWIRLCTSMTVVAGKYSQHNKGSRPVSEETQKKYEDL